MSYLDELGRELRAVGIRGGRRCRILAEVDDHLRESGDIAAFGEARLVAQRFADELATAGARRSAYGAFAALVPAGIVYAVLFLSLTPGPDITSAKTLPLGLLAAAAMLLAPQVALACASLAVLRAWRLRCAPAVPAAEVRILRRRTALALAAGAVTLGAIAVYAYEYGGGLPRAWVVGALASSAFAVLPLAAASRGVVASGRLRAAVTGEPGDLLDDLTPLSEHVPVFPRSPWRFCVGFAAAVGLAAFVGGVIGGQPDEGLRNALGETLAVCAGFAVFGRFLGLRR